jgi:NADPH2:quinone reductase
VRAAFHDRYGPPEVLRVVDVAEPTPLDEQVLVRVRASTANQTDCHMRRASPFPWRLFLGLRRPRPQYRVPGSEFAGEVEAVGSAVTRFAVRDRVFVIRRGANAEYVCVPQSGVIAHVPAGASFEEAAAVFDGFFQGQSAMRRGKVGKGTRLLVYGASGSCGTAAVQLGKHLGASVTAVCNTDNVELVRSLGADEVIDYLKEDFTKNGQTYDVLLDAVGKLSFPRSRRSVREGGLWIATDGLQNLFHALWSPWFGKRKVGSSGIQRPKQEDILSLKRLMEAGKYRAVIDGVYPLEEIPNAQRRVESWQKRGSVVIALPGS